MFESKFNKYFKQILLETAYTPVKRHTTGDLPLQDITKDYPFYVVMRLHHIVRGFDTKEEAQLFLNTYHLDPFYFKIQTLEQTKKIFKDIHDKFNWEEAYRTLADEIMRDYENPEPGRYTGD